MPANHVPAMSRWQEDEKIIIANLTIRRHFSQSDSPLGNFPFSSSHCVWFLRLHSPVTFGGIVSYSATMTVESIPTTRMVGELACQKNSYLETLGTMVMSCTERPTEVSAGKKDKKVKNASDRGSSDSPKIWEIEFADSVLFPEGGGQPADYGTIITPGSPSHSIPITSVQRHGLRCVVLSPEPLRPGTTVQQKVDFHRRWDHMQQHTGQHLLSAIMDTYDNLDTLSWGMGAEGEMNYVELPRKPSPEEMQEIQDKCNEIIRQNVEITVETPEDYKPHKLPENYDKEKGVIRVIKIGDLDKNTCCGTHLSQTSHISVILLHHIQPVRGTNFRLFFTAGDRAINLASSSIRSQKAIAKVLGSSSSPSELLEKVTRMTETVTELSRREKKLMMEIAKLEGERIKPILQTGRNAFLYRVDGGLDFINAVVSEVKDCCTAGVFVLASGEGKKGGPIVIVGEEKAVAETAEKIKDVIHGVKGGGKGVRWQGRVLEWGKGDLEALKKVVEG